MHDASLKELSRRERRELQNQVGLVPLESRPDNHRRKKGRRHMHDNGTQTQRSDDKDRAKRSLEEFFGSIRTPSAWELAKQSAVKAAVYAPVALSVGTGLLFIARRLFTPR